MRHGNNAVSSAGKYLFDLEQIMYSHEFFIRITNSNITFFIFLLPELDFDMKSTLSKLSGPLYWTLISSLNFGMSDFSNLNLTQI